MNYWIFVHKNINEDTGKTFVDLLSKQNWVFSSYYKPQKDDVIIFYLGGPKYMYFAGEAKLTSDILPPNRDPIGDRDNYPIKTMVEFDNIDRWNGKKIYLTRRDIRDKLNFIRNIKYIIKVI